MNGIRIELEIGGDREKVFFATRRAGEPGAQMRAAQKTFHANRLAAVRVMNRINVAAGELDEGNAAALEELDAKIGALGNEARDLSEQARACAETFVRLSLGENYGEADIGRFLQNLTDAQVAQLVGIVETGSVPADFFPSRATPPNGSTITPPAAGPGASSLSTDSPAPTSMPGT